MISDSTCTRSPGPATAAGASVIESFVSPSVFVITVEDGPINSSQYRSVRVAAVTLLVLDKSLKPIAVTSTIPSPAVDKPKVGTLGTSKSPDAPAEPAIRHRVIGDSSKADSSSRTFADLPDT